MVIEEVFVGRKPILDLNNHIHGFELLFHTGEDMASGRVSAVNDSFTAEMESLYDFGLHELAGQHHRIFIKVDSTQLMEDWLMKFPKDRVVLELDHNIQFNQSLISRCAALKERGYTLALSHYEYKPAVQALFEHINIVKFDLLALSPESIQEMILPLQRRPITLLAENVEDMYQFDRMRELGFELFQGYYFARPSIIVGKKIDPSSLTVMKLMGQVSNDADMGEIEKTFRESPSLTYHLLRLINSPALGIRNKIESIRQAIVLLGRDQLKKWSQVLLFTYEDTPGERSPLLQTSSMRARLMEILVEKGALEGSKDQADLAFMTGMFSLIDALLMRPMAEVLSDLNLSESVYEALLNREGDLGKLLQLVEKVEQCNYPPVERLVTDYNLTPTQLFSAEQEAAVWTKKVVEVF